MISSAEYGISLEELMKGKVPMPPEGVRLDAHFEGVAIGEKLKGTVRGVDYLWMRPNGGIEMDIHAEITTESGEKISLKGDGASFTRENNRISDIRANIALFTSHKNYTWMNTLQVWGIGTVDMATQIIAVKAYSAMPGDV
ncbi:MAG TPA: hypothetical protein VGM63_23945 [Mucilaginibacter sp.]